MCRLGSQPGGGSLLGSMSMYRSLKARFPKLFPIMTAVAALGLVGGLAAWERRANAAESCCYPGAPCCHPGAACCAAHKHAAKE